MLYNDYEKLLKLHGTFYYVGSEFFGDCLTCYTGNSGLKNFVNLNILLEDANDFGKWKYWNRNIMLTEILGEKFIW